MKLPSFSKRIYKALIGSLFGMAWIMSAHATTNDYENLASLGSEVLEHARSIYSQDPSNLRIRLKLSGLDNRLKLAKCSRNHDLSLQDAMGMGGRVNVAVACRDTNGWAILVPVTASIYRNIPVANHNLTVGSLLSESDLNTEERELSDLRLGYFLTAQDLIGKQVKFALSQGDAFRTSWVEAPITVKRGEEVSLEAEAGAIRVITRGTAISDGRLGQQIRVKNNQSEKVVNAKVLAPGRVKTVL